MIIYLVNFTVVNNIATLGAGIAHWIDDDFQKLADAIFNLPKTLGKLDIFPNPVQNDLNFTFESSFNGDLEVIITDVKGQMILNFVMEKNAEKISRVHSVTKLLKGVYQLTISNGNELTTKAFVK